MALLSLEMFLQEFNYEIKFWLRILYLKSEKHESFLQKLL